MTPTVASMMVFTLLITGNPDDDSGDGWGSSVDGDHASVIVGEAESGGAAGDDRSNTDMASWEPVSGDAQPAPERDEPLDASLAACMSDAERRICLPDYEFGEGPTEDPGEDATDEEIVDVVSAVVERAWDTFQIQPSPVIVQPAGGEVLVGMYTIFYTEAHSQQFSTTLLGRQVVLEVEPIRYEWDFGDGSQVLATSDPGAPYPQQTITHTYEQAGAFVPELTTRWVGRVWIEGIGGWFAVRGQGVTTGQGDPLEAVSKQNRLVPAP